MNEQKPRGGPVTAPAGQAGTPGQAAYEAWAAVLATNGVECEPFEKLGNVEQMAWREVQAIAAAAPAGTPTREQVIARLAAAFGPHKAAVSRKPDEDHRHPWTEFVPSGNDERGSTLIVFRDTDGQNSMRPLTYGEIADALCEPSAESAAPAGTQDAPALMSADDYRKHLDQVFAPAYGELERLRAGLNIAPEQPQPAPGPDAAMADVSGVYRERDRLRQALQLMADDGSDEAADHLDQIEPADTPLALTPVQAARLAVAEDWQPRVDALRQQLAESQRELAIALERMDERRESIAKLIDELKTTAAATHPSKKSEIEFALIRKLRALLDQP